MWLYSHSLVSMMVADALMPIWHLDIGNRHDDILCLQYFVLMCDAFFIRDPAGWLI